MVQPRRRWFKFPLVPLALCAIVIAALVLRTHYHHGSRAVKAGEPLPALSLVSLDGSPVNVVPMHGTVIYNVFATWCPPCREETPTIARAAVKFHKRGIEVVGIDQGEPASAVTAFAHEFNLGYPIMVDPNRQTNVLLGARVIPETIVVRDGVVRAINVGPLDAPGLDRLVAASGEPHA